MAPRDHILSEQEEQKVVHLLKLAKIDLTEPCAFQNVTKLDLSGCGLSELPTGFSAVLPNLAIMFLSKNNFQEMPAVIGQCSELQMVAFRDNQMEAIHPDALQPQLRWLILTNNRLKTIPETIGRCSKLQKLMLSGNLLEAIPESITACKNLELVRLASNQLKEPPMQLMGLPNLAWIALSDNPFLHVTKASKFPLKIINDIPENEGEILGGGAGGVVRKVMWNDQYVAVKEFRGTMTSDGLPEEECRISCVAATLNCESLIQIYGETPGGSLVMEYLDRFQALAGPPSFESCSRDVYGEYSVELTYPQAEKIVSKVLDALSKLHSKGICHGDFYGHNILVSTEDPAYIRLSDFGAAFFYDRTALYGTVLERIELRAFAIFVEEVRRLLIDDDGAPFEELQNILMMQGKSFEEVQIWWSQKQLAGLANAFDLDD